MQKKFAKFRKKMKFLRKKSFFAFCNFMEHSPFTKTTIAECGHSTKRRGIVKSPNGESVAVCLEKKPEFCLKCFENSIIICPMCEKLICESMPVAIWTPREFVSIPYGSKILSMQPLELVICTRSTCAYTEMMVGNWIVPGEIYPLSKRFE